MTTTQKNTSRTRKAAPRTASLAELAREYEARFRATGKAPFGESSWTLRTFRYDARVILEYFEFASNIAEFYWRDVQEFSFSSELIQPGKSGRFRPLDQAKRIMLVLRALLVFARQTGLIEEVSWPTQMLKCVRIPAPAPRKARQVAA